MASLSGADSPPTYLKVHEGFARLLKGPLWVLVVSKHLGGRGIAGFNAPEFATIIGERNFADTRLNKAPIALKRLSSASQA